MLVRRIDGVRDGIERKSFHVIEKERIKARENEGKMKRIIDCCLVLLLYCKTIYVNEGYISKVLRHYLLENNCISISSIFCDISTS